MTDQTTSPVITLDLEDTALVARLKAKAEEYKERLAANPYSAPEQMAGTTYRLRLLEELLEHGTIDTWDLSRTINSEMGWIRSDRFDNACGVVTDYIETGGANTIGGKLPVV